MKALQIGEFLAAPDLKKLSSKVRISLRKQLAERFGYTTETIYPDLNGFALAFNQYAPLA